MKKLSIAIMSLASIMLLGACDSTAKKIVVENDLGIDRKGELVTLYMQGDEEVTVFTKGYVIVDKDGNQVPYQVLPRDVQNDPYSATIIFPADVPANGKATYKWERGKRNISSLAPRVYSNIYNNRFSDFAWENDRIAFRIYHQNLIPTDGPSNGIDVFAKRTDSLILDEFFDGRDYHKDHGKGVDFYKVGRTLGAGAMAPIDSVGNLILGENYDNSPEFILNGPLRTSAKVTYRPIYVGGQVVLEERTITLDYGSQMSRIDVEYVNMPAGTTVAAGIVSRDEACTRMAKSSDWAAYSEADDPTNGTLYIGVLSQNGWDKVECHQKHVLAYTKPDADNRVTYYQGAGWSKFGFPDFASWQQYLTDFKAKLDSPLKATVK